MSDGEFIGNKETENRNFKITVISVILFGIILTVLIFSSIYHYLLFHSLSEMISIIIATGIFVIGWNTRKFTDSQFFIIFGISSFFTGIIDLLHTLAYDGMAIFIGYTANLPTQLWIVARYIQSFSLLFALIIPRKKINYGLIALGYMLVTAFLLILIFTGVFPTAYIPNIGLTPFKVVSEYIIIGILVVSVGVLITKRKEFYRNILYLIIFAIISMIISELSFTLYIGVFEFTNFIGHIFKAIAFFCIYLGIIQIGLNNPISMLFKQLKEREASLDAAYKRTNFYKDLFTHDIANVLQNIMANLELIYHTSDKQSIKPEINQFLDGINTQLMESRTLINNIIKLSELEGMHKSLEPINPFIDLLEVIEYIKNSHPKSHLTINITPPDTNLSVKANNLLRDVFDNLIRNAIKYNNRTPINIEIKYAMVIKDRQHQLKLEFIDNGIGVSPEQKAIIFKRGFGNMKGGKGMGLGLSLVKQILHLYGGDIWVEDRIQGDYTQGSNFSMLLPILSE